MADSQVVARLSRHVSSSDEYASRFVDDLLDAAQEAHASDIHLQPVKDGLQIRWRLDGVLQLVGTFPRGSVTDIVTRVKVLAHLLTYRSDVPQEGRIQTGYRHVKPNSVGATTADVEMRVSTFPTLYGERAAIRLFAKADRFARLDDLGFADDCVRSLRELLSATSGAILISGPAGSGKTTTAYAALRELVEITQGGRSLVSLEDPIEVAVDGLSQSQVNLAADFTLVTGLKSLLRQDPEVLLIGEMRDAETAQLCLQASLAGQLVITTFHAGSAVETVRRLLEMGLEPYLLRSGIRAIVNQRLLRRLCECSTPNKRAMILPGEVVIEGRDPSGCAACHQTGYRGRLLIAEFLRTDTQFLAEAVLRSESTHVLQQLAEEAGMVALRQQALQAIVTGATSAAEVMRVFGVHEIGPATNRLREGVQLGTISIGAETRGAT